MDGSCLQVKIKSIPIKLKDKVNIGRLNSPPKVIFYKEGGIKTIISLLSSSLLLKVLNLLNPPNITITTKSANLSVNCSIVCSVGIDSGREVFMVKEGVFLVAEGGAFKVIKNGIPK